MDEFDVQIERLPDKCAITATGELDIASVDQLRTAFSSALLEQPVLIEVDLRGVTFIDSTGLHLLFDMRQLAAPARVEFLTSPIVDRLLDITGLTDMLVSNDAA